MTFIASNVLIYVADDTDAEKLRIARNVVERLAELSFSEPSYP